MELLPASITEYTVSNAKHPRAPKTETCVRVFLKTPDKHSPGPYYYYMSAVVFFGIAEILKKPDAVEFAEYCDGTYKYFYIKRDALNFFELKSDVRFEFKYTTTLKVLVALPEDGLILERGIPQHFDGRTVTYFFSYQ